MTVARVAVDTPLAHLDRLFDYADPEGLAQPGVRVRVRFAGRLVDGFVVERADSSEHKLTPIAKVVSPEPVLSPEIAGLARAVADRWAGTLSDVLRLAVPPRVAKVEAEPPLDPLPLPPVPEPGSWTRYDNGPGFLDALASGGMPRATWRALPGPTWPDEVATAARATLAGGRGVVVVVPDARDLVRVTAALGDAPHVALSADLGPTPRYRAWLSVRRGTVRCVVGTRSAAFAPVADLGLVVCWDDGDDLHEEQRAPYPHVREVLALRAHRSGAAALLGGFAPSVEAHRLVAAGWSKPLAARRAVVRETAPRVEVSGDDPGRLPTKAWEIARGALRDGAPVLVQVPRTGYQPALGCASCRAPARCATCSGPLGRTGAVPSCRWCGRPATDWRCPACGDRGFRAVVTGSRRTAEELGRAFAGVPVRTSDREGVVARVPDEPALVVATPGAEPVAAAGYGAVLLLDATALLARADLRAAEEALRRWLNAAALARPSGRVVVVADGALPVVQALVRWDPATFADREYAERAELGFPPAVRMAAVDGAPDAVADLLAAAEPLPPGATVLGPVEREGGERALVRVPREQGAELARRLAAAQAVRSARKAEGSVRVRLDPLVVL